MIPLRAVDRDVPVQPLVLMRRRPGVTDQTKMDRWTDRWVCVGFADQLRRAGDVLPATIGLHPIHIRRDSAGCLVAAFNARPFGGCMSIPVQCAGSRKIRCPNLACAFSEDPEVLGDDNDRDGQARRQFVGVEPNQLVTVPLVQLGPLLFVYVGAGSAPSMQGTSSCGQSYSGPYSKLDTVAGGTTASDITAHVLPLGLNAATTSVMHALASRYGIELHRDLIEDGNMSRYFGSNGASRVVAYILAPNLLVAQVPNGVLAAVFRPTGRAGSSVVGAVLRKLGCTAPGADGCGVGESVADAWRLVMASAV